MYMYIYIYKYVYIWIHTYIHAYTYIYIYAQKYRYIHICNYKYLVWYNSPCLLTKFLINIYDTICEIKVHSFSCWDVILLQP